LPSEPISLLHSVRFGIGIKFLIVPWRRGIVVISNASRRENPGFESRPGVRFLGLYVYIVVLLLKLNMHRQFLRETKASKKEFLKKFFMYVICVFEKNKIFQK
jgi:hypothetical protein